MPSPSDFFNEPKERSLDKLWLFGDYLTPLTYKLGSRCGPSRRDPWSHVWVVDGCAGAGGYKELDASGRIWDGSPLVAAKWAEQERIRRGGYPVMRCINVEADPDCFAELRRNLAPYGDVAVALQGEFVDHVNDIIAMIGNDPALVFIDPFGVNGIEMEVLERLLAQRERSKTELLIHFSDKTFKRMAGHLTENAARTPVGVKSANSKLEKLDRVIGTPLWRRIWNSALSNEEAMDKIADLYVSELRSRVGFADQIPMRDHWGDVPPYRLVFCTGSPHGIEQMSHLAHKHEAELKARMLPGQMNLLADNEEREKLTALRNAIEALGIERGTITLDEIRHTLVPKRFRLHAHNDYAKAVRELVKAGVIERDTPTGIKDDEPLTFVPPAQGSLLGS
jgi:three-Cys-motif partner protein